MSKVESFGKENAKLILEVRETAMELEPVLIIRLNPAWEAVNDAALIVQSLLAHGGIDTKGSNFIFHFETLQELIEAQSSLRKEAPNAFHFSPDAVIYINRLMPPELPPIAAPVATGEAWIMSKISGVMTTDFAFDPSFFWK